MLQEKISSGSYDLNKFLYGGYESDIITTIYGPGGSGKSNLCMIVATSLAKKGKKVFFIDTEGGFSTERFKQIHRGEKEEIENDLQNIFLLKPTSFEEQEQAFQKLLAHLKKETVSLIIIDSIAMLYRLELGSAISSKDSEKISDVNRNLANQLRTLNEIARKKNIPVVITNQVYASFQEENSASEKKVSMVGGDLLKYWSKCLIELSGNNFKRKITLQKHRSLPVKNFNFEIINSGIRKKGMF
ncbi:DNA repair and recombination protein RadB [archaeon]|jgi:DNA repair protein RadB|nr:DNA repair and recombination protein RadB [archaeon]MBT6182832.1 DNA repair and recombination protein RadB [archaeon]MBT6606792.1 DNA repair and recombination protein RadB [archaeon]MBT7251735.1 DNA repair and recombination protein RadB [archaeon]MBT7660518.1 DNA repair and recombination protein RadB [archaeon]